MLLRDISEVHGPSFLHLVSPNEANDSHVYFTMSDPTELRTFYRSAASSELGAPSWSCVDMAESTQLLADLSIVLFRFFIATQSNNQVTSTLVLQTCVDLEKINKLGSVIPPFASRHTNQLVLSCGGDFFVWSCDASPPVSPQPVKSYNLVRIKEILRTEEALSANEARFKELHSLLGNLNEQGRCLSLQHERSAKLHTRLSALRACLSGARQRLVGRKALATSLKDELASVAKEVCEVQKASTLLSRRLESVSGRVESNNASVKQLLQLCNIRKFHMIGELCELFPIEAVGCQTKRQVPIPSKHLISICRTVLVDSDAPGTSSTSIASWLDVGDGLQPKLSSVAAGQTTGATAAASGGMQPPAEESIRLTQSARTLLLANKAQTAAVSLGHVVSFLQILSAILDVPLRYPLSTVPMGSCRSHVIDPVIAHLEDGERRFPLYIQRNVSLPAYRYGVFLLNRNIALLRAFFGLATPHQRATLWNLMHLIDTRLLCTDRLRTSRLSPVTQPRRSVSRQTREDANL
uniref:Methyltransferase-like protein 2 n=2 Tax=Schistocephalus solidus TaxID=70667 RepID=A0A0V0J5X4_SCHSO